jgi:hypothetical protein
LPIAVTTPRRSGWHHRRSWYASPATHVGYELIGAAVLILAGGAVVSRSTSPKVKLRDDLRCAGSNPLMRFA